MATEDRCTDGDRPYQRAAAGIRSGLQRAGVPDVDDAMPFVEDVVSGAGSLGRHVGGEGGRPEEVRRALVRGIDEAFGAGLREAGESSG